MKRIEICHECGSHQLRWQASVENTGGVVDGRVRMHEVRGVLFLGCEECSETLQVVSADDVAEFLNDIQKKRAAK